MNESLPNYDAWKLATPPEHREAPDDYPDDYPEDDEETKGDEAGERGSAAKTFMFARRQVVVVQDVVEAIMNAGFEPEETADRIRSLAFALARHHQARRQRQWVVDEVRKDRAERAKRKPQKKRAKRAKKVKKAK